MILLVGKIFKAYYAYFPKVDLVKSLYYSLIYKGIIIIGKANIRIDRKGLIIFTDKKASLYIGVHYTASVTADLTIFNQGVLKVGRSVSLCRGCKIVIGSDKEEKAVLTIGNNSYINEYSRIFCGSKIIIGENCSISWYCNIMDTDVHSILVNGVKTNNNKPIQIGNNVWIGANAVISKGTIIEDNCIIGINSFVKGKCYSNNIYIGNPAVSVRTFDMWEN